MACRIFYSIGEDIEDRGPYEIQELQSEGFADVRYENKGARRTIFDDYDTLEHFVRVAEFRDTVAPLLKGGAEDASELVMILEDLNPQLFNALGAAVAALRRAQHEEDIAQASLSGRRYLERLADTLFPPRDSDHKGRKVSREHYRNRIWAFIADNISDEIELKKIGTELDRLVEEFNAGLHADLDKPRILRALADAGSLTAALLALNPDAARKPYAGHEKRILEFFYEMRSSREKIIGEHSP